MDTQTDRVRVLRQPETLRRVALKRSTLYDLIKRGLFPKPFQLVPGGRAVGWLESDVERYIKDRKAASDMGAV